MIMTCFSLENKAYYLKFSKTLFTIQLNISRDKVTRHNRRFHWAEVTPEGLSPVRTDCIIFSTVKNIQIMRKKTKVALIPCRYWIHTIWTEKLSITQQSVMFLTIFTCITPDQQRQASNSGT
jgi:hypothetical protein